MGKIVRGNPQIWRIAKWLYENFTPLGPSGIWGKEEVMNYNYDRAILLYAKILNNDFTGPDISDD